METSGLRVRAFAIRAPPNRERGRAVPQHLLPSDFDTENEHLLHGIVFCLARKYHLTFGVRLPGLLGGVNRYKFNTCSGCFVAIFNAKTASYGISNCEHLSISSTHHTIRLGNYFFAGQNFP